MKKQIIPPNRGYDALVYINNIEIAGQTNASVSQNTNVIDITNKITGEWENSIAGVRSWEVRCSGLTIKGAAAFEQLQNAFKNGDKVTIKLSDNNINYNGQAIIISFPLVANYNDTYTYNVVFRGVGALNNI